MEQTNITAQLIEPNIRYLLFNTLQKCHDYRVKYYNIIFNITIFVVFVSVTGMILFYSYKKKPTEEEKRHKLLRDQQYVLSKIRFYKDEMKKNNTSSITSLPILPPKEAY
jgi:hypothetical protein